MPAVLQPRATAIPGLTIWTLPVHRDPRGWFKENWQREKMTAAGLPDFGPVQNNVAFNADPGVTRGIHAEPWDKWISVTSGRVFGAWLDLRQGDSFGTVVTVDIDPGTAVFVPRGVGNAYQTLEPATAYSYLVNAHWSPDSSYMSVNLGDPDLGIAWPIPLDHAIVSEKDRCHPRLSEVTPIVQKSALVLGATGQLGQALRTDLGESLLPVRFSSRAEADLTDLDLANKVDWRDFDVIINAAAHTAVDAAETAEGRGQAWATNAAGVATLAKIAIEHQLTLVHISSDYVFDGTSPDPYSEDDRLCPVGVYGATKAAGEHIVSAVPRNYVIRTSWVYGEGRNFIRTMADLARRGKSPAVVNDQIGRPTAATDIARGILHLLRTKAPYGLYNLTGAGDAASWYEVARHVYTCVGADPDLVRPVSTVEYAAASAPLATRPANSVLTTSKIESSGFRPRPWADAVQGFLGDQIAHTGPSGI